MPRDTIRILDVPEHHRHRPLDRSGVPRVVRYTGDPTDVTAGDAIWIIGSSS